MISYLQKFNNLDVELREKVSGPKVMEEMKRLEGKYRVNLATVIMRLMVQDISILDLAKFFMFEYEMEARHAELLVEEMKKTVLVDVAEHIGFSKDIAQTLEESNKNDLDTWKNRQGKTKVKTSDFFFSTEDEEEVRNLAKKLETFKIEKEKKGETIETVQNLTEIVEEVIKRINLNFSSEELSDRFIQIINTYVKNVRNKIDTKATLMKDVQSGGMDLNEELSTKVMSVIDQVKEEYKDKKPIQKPRKIKLPEDVASSSVPPISSEINREKGDDKKGKGIIPARDVDYDFSQLKKTSAQQGSKDPASHNLGQTKQDGEQKKDESKSSVISNMKEVYSDDKMTVDDQSESDESLNYDKVIKEDVLNLNSQKQSKSKLGKDKKTSLNEVNLRITKKEPESVVETVGIKRQTINKGATGVSTGKVKMEDVKFVPKLVGPIDELREMSLEDWRRLGNSPLEATDKIIEKIQFLEKESYKKRLAGIKAWRQSPVNLAYLKIGQSSMQHSNSLLEAIGDISRTGEKTLTVDEFNAVMELNKKLRF